MRTSKECQEFFVIGRVFAMLWSEAAGASTAATFDDYAYSVVRFGTKVYTTIRRFIVVQVRRGFVYAW